MFGPISGAHYNPAVSLVFLLRKELNNNDFVKRAPKHIVEQEKTNYNNLKNDIDKILVTIKGI